MKSKNFRIKRSSKIDELVNQNQLLQKTLQRIVGGRNNEAKGTPYNRVMGLFPEEQTGV